MEKCKFWISFQSFSFGYILEAIGPIASSRLNDDITTLCIPIAELENAGEVLARPIGFSMLG